MKLKSHTTYSKRGFLHIYAISFPRFPTFCIWTVLILGNTNNTGVTLNMSLNPKMFINELRTTTSSTDSSKPSSWRSWGSVMKRKDSSMLYMLYNYYGTIKHDWVLISNLLENYKILPLPRSVICTCVRITMLCESRLRIERSESLLLSGCAWDPC